MGESSADQRSSGLSLEQAVPEGSATQRCNSPHAVGCRTDRENEQVHRGALPLSECLGPTLDPNKGSWRGHRPAGYEVGEGTLAARSSTSAPRNASMRGKER